MNVGHAQVGFNAFLDKYLDSLLTNGRAVGEIVPDAEGREIAAVLCHRVEQLALREGETALDVRFCGYDAAGRLRELPRQELVLFTPLLPESENPYGVSLLRSNALYGGAALAHLLRGGAELGALRQRALRGGLQAAGRGAGRRAGARAGRAAGAGVVRRDAGDARRERARLCERGRREHPRHRRGQRDAGLRGAGAADPRAAGG